MWLRPVRVRLKVEHCTLCAACVPVCPIGLNPMRNEFGIECDNCGLCISHCDDDALDYGIAIRDGASLGEHLNGSRRGTVGANAGTHAAPTNRKAAA